MKEVFPGIYEWSWYSEEKGYDFNGHAVRDGKDWILIDPPPFSDGDRPWTGTGVRIGRVYLTNRDHVREAGAIREEYRIEIWAPEQDAGLMEIRMDRTFNDDDVLPGGFRAIGIPDHKSPGETALYLEQSRGIVFIGDAVIGRPPGKLSLLPPDKFKDIRRAKEGLKALLRHPFESLLLGDGASIPIGGRAALERLLAESVNTA